MSDIQGLPPGAFVLDCRPYAPPKLLQVDPATLTPAQRMDICTGSSTFSVHPTVKLDVDSEGKISVVPAEGSS